MKPKKTRYLKRYFPFLENNENLPIGYDYTQLYTGIVLDDKGIAIAFEDVEKIHIEQFQIPEVNLYPVFHKPISKFLVIEDND